MTVKTVWIKGSYDETFNSTVWTDSGVVQDNAVLPPVVVTLTGVQATMSANSFGQTTNETPGGAQAILSAGSLSTIFLKTLPGAQATTHASNIVVSDTQTLPGTQVTMQAGVLPVTPDVLLPGLASVAEIGRYTADIIKLLIGDSATAQVGGAVETISITIPGVATLASVSAFTPNIIINLSGVAATAAHGLTSVTSGADVATFLPTESASSAISSFIPSLASFLVGDAAVTGFSPLVFLAGQHLPGAVITSSANNFTFDIVGNLQGVEAVSASNFVYIVLISLAGQEVVTDIASVTPSVSIVVYLPSTATVLTEISDFVVTGTGPRDFYIAGIASVPIAPGIVMLPTSEEHNPVTVGSNTYVFGSSQFYTIGEVYWNSVKKVETTDWVFVSPFSHIIQILNPVGIITPITLIYYRWNIGVRSGFKVNAYPVPFGFTGTTIVAEQIPALGMFFTVQYTSTRSGTNPVSLLARYPTIIDEILPSHTLYDGDSGFETYRPAGYTVYDEGDNNIWIWSGSSWSISGTIPINGKFYVKRERIIYQFDGTHPLPVYTAGDGLNPLFPEVLEYPAYGEGIGKNLLDDAFSPSASVDHPASYEIALRPGNYDDWLGI